MYYRIQFRPCYHEPLFFYTLRDRDGSYIERAYFESEEECKRAAAQALEDWKKAGRDLRKEQA